MKKLSEMKQGETAIVSSVNGDARYVGRITSIGLTPGCKVSIIKNEKNRPIIVFARDTMIALNEKESSNIEVEEARG
ncbi:MAG: ferrous iron transport protein A [Ruminococcaceae bacterium]|nr:ferrous iron transport protein A [Oscillospiraceae bacterium]